MDELEKVIKEAEVTYEKLIGDYDERILCGPKALADELERERIRRIAQAVRDAGYVKKHPDDILITHDG